MRFAVLLVALVACKDIPNEQPQKGSGSGSETGMIPTPRAQFEAVYDKLPDEADWKSAARVAIGGWSEAFNKLGATQAKVTPLAGPDGSIAKYLFRVEAFKGTASVFKGIGLIANGSLINGSGGPRLEKHFAAIGFPKTQLSIGHLITMLHVARAVDAEWTPLPDTYDWKFDGKAKLAYDDNGALLTLYKDSKHIDVRIDNGGLITKSAPTD